MPRKFKEAFPMFRVADDEVSKTLPVVIYAPKYDTRLREEYDVEVTKDGKFRVTTTRVSQRNVIDFVGEFENYEEAREIMFAKFNQDFNRPSEFAIRHGGRSPAERVWDYTEGGRKVKASISIVEGSKSVQVVEYKPRVVTLKIRKQAPLVVSVRSLYPKYFEKSREKHDVRLTRLRRMRRKSFRRR